MQNKETDYLEAIVSCSKYIDKYFNGKEWKDDETITKMFGVYYKAIYNQIHLVLVPQKSESSEKQIREILAKYVIGYSDKKVGKNYIGSLTPIKAKIHQLSGEKILRNEYAARYLELYDNFMALASFRSFKHFCQYIERDVFGIDLWKKNERAFSGYWYYTNRQMLDGEVTFMEKQLPTGTGKSLSDAFKQAWGFGLDIDYTAFKVCGNDKFTNDCFNNVIKIMTCPKYAKIFPYYRQFKCQENAMFSTCSAAELKLVITGAKFTSLRICTKLARTNGVRAKHLYIDDITQQDDSQSQMQTDIEKFMREWFRRNFDLQHFYVDASGTAYSQFDPLSWLKRKNNFENSVVSKINEFTHIAKSDFVRKDGKAVFVIVPALDKNDESVFPDIRPTDALKKLRLDDYATFMAMEQQDPLPPDSSPFYYTKLRQYAVLPPIGENGRMENCVAALDPKRRGKDYVSMPICFEANDPERPTETVFYVVDWLYDNRPMKDCIPLIISKIIQHHITRLYVERNTDELIAPLLLDKLQEQGYTSCVIDEVYSTEQKDRRIMAAEGDIKSKIIFPEFGMYANSSSVGSALNCLYGYNYDRKNAHDDAPDSLALFTKRFIAGKGKRAKAKLLYI